MMRPHRVEFGCAGAALHPAPCRRRHAARRCGYGIGHSGEAIALNAGTLVTTVREIIDYGLPIAILDASAECHMPDVIEMPYRPPIKGAGKPGEKRYTYRLGGPTCLAGDVIGDYSFARRLKPGNEIVFGDMAIYTMVKNNTFNGMQLPSIALRKKSGRIVLLRAFGYEDFRRRLGNGSK